MILDEDENIDTSQFLPRGMSIITPERAAKGDILIERAEPAFEGQIGHIRFAQVQVRKILNFLWQEDIITDEQHNDGHTFEAWRNQHRVALGQQRAISSDTAPSSTVKLRAFGFVLILRRLSIYDHKAIEQSIETVADDFQKQMALRSKQTYRRAYERLSDVLTHVRGRIEALEALSDEERNDLFEEGLKNLIDKGLRNV